MNINDEIMQLIIKHLSNKSSGVDDSALKAWLAEKTEHQLEFEKIKKIWETSGSAIAKPMDVHSEWEKFRSKHFDLKKKEPKVIWMPAARWAAYAAAVLILGVFIGIQYLNQPQEYNTGAGERLLVKLDDGSEVILGEYSTLTIGKKFNDDKRKVKLDGEGFFTVAKNPSKPFEISGSKTTTRILGTAFQLVTKPSNNYLNVAEGKVAYWDNTNKDTLILTRGERGEVKNGKLKESKLDDPNYDSWKTGIFVFDNKPVIEVLDEIQDYYLFDAPNLSLYKNLNCRFSGKFSNQTLESVLEELGLIMGMEYTLKDSTLSIQSFSCK